MLITCYEITYNFIVSKNLNKNEILYPQKRITLIYNDNRERMRYKKKKEWCILQSNENVRIYRSKR